ncbi:MAG TPA: hypothetical protein VLM76_11045 [Patescibacteria group bacterium]|nr:hypothetical protein [Patescibacteria group bacterium]
MSVRSRLPRPLRILVRGSAPPAGPGEPSPDHLAVPIVGLTLYTGDSLAFGYLPLPAGRVTDLMNDHEEFEFVDTYLQSLGDGHGLALRSVAIARDEIFVAAVAGPRGDPRRRTRTRPIPIEMRLGPYGVWGNLHVIPGADPLISFRSRRPMVPLTEATIEWDSPDGRQVVRWDTVVVNRLRTDWIAPATRDVRPRDLHLVPEGDSGLGRDFTAQLLRR